MGLEVAMDRTGIASHSQFAQVPAIHFFGFPGYYTASPPRLAAHLFEDPAKRARLKEKGNLGLKTFYFCEFSSFSAFQRNWWHLLNFLLWWTGEEVIGEPYIRDLKKAPGWGKHESLSSLTKPSWLCDCLAKGDAQHLDVTFCRQENSVEDITIRFQDPSQLLEQVGQNDDFKATNISTKTLLLFIWGWEHKHSPFFTRFVGLFRGGDQRPDWWFSTSEWRWQWTAERTDEHGRSRSTTRRNTRNTRSWNEAGRWNPKE